MVDRFAIQSPSNPDRAFNVARVDLRHTSQVLTSRPVLVGSECDVVSERSSRSSAVSVADLVDLDDDDLCIAESVQKRMDYYRTVKRLSRDKIHSGIICYRSGNRLQIRTFSKLNTANVMPHFTRPNVLVTEHKIGGLNDFYAFVIEQAKTRKWPASTLNVTDQEAVHKIALVHAVKESCSEYFSLFADTRPERDLVAEIGELRKAIVTAARWTIKKPRTETVCGGVVAYPTDESVLPAVH